MHAGAGGPSVGGSNHKDALEVRYAKNIWIDEDGIFVRYKKFR